MENLNKTIGTIPRAYVSENQREWDLHLPKVLCVYRSDVHASKRFTPNLPVDLVYGGAAERFNGTTDFTKQTCKRMEDIYKLVRIYLSSAGVQQNIHYDQKSGRAVLC